MLIGYAFTAAYIILLASLIGSAILSRKQIVKAFKGKIDLNTAVVTVIIVMFFVIFSLNYVYPVEQLYFDENIYQGIALNILHHGNAVWCQFGSANTLQCPVSQIYHDPVEWSFYLAIAFLLFGTGIATAYGLSLFAGALSIVFVFLLGSLLAGKRAGVISAFTFSLIPELFIWSRTQAVPDLGLMMFSVLAFLCYAIYSRQKSNTTLTMFLSSLGIALYMRIEAALLIPIFILIYLFSDPKLDLRRKITSMVLGSINQKSLIVLIFLVLLVPQIYYISYEFSTLDYGSGTICNTTSTSTFSISNFMCNVYPNLYYFIGNYNSIGYYPAYFAVETTAIALIGFITIAALAHKNKKELLLLLGLWIVAYHLFYDFFYAGSVTYGVDVRFMLEIYPAMAILAGIAMDDIATFIGQRSKSVTAPIVGSSIVAVILVIAFVIYPFAKAYPNVTILPQNMPQEGGPLTATNFIYTEYSNVPAHCLVFTFTPDIWYELNRSAAQVGYVGSSDLNFTVFASKYSCYVLDYGYWCVVPPFHGSTCSVDTMNYKTSVIVSSPSAPGQEGNLTLYKLLNYTPPALSNSSFR